MAVKKVARCSSPSSPLSTSSEIHECSSLLTTTTPFFRSASMLPRPTPISRPKHTANRLSAVYIGSNPLATQSQFASASPSYFTSPPNIDNPHIPDLPEPPSPGGSSNGSGLPSPPATNSTGSGSTDGPETLLIRERPLSFNGSSGSSTGGSFSLGPSMLRGSNGRTLHRSNSSISSVSTSSRLTERQSKIDEEHRGERNDVRVVDDHEYSQNANDDEEGDDTARLNLNMRHPRQADSNENTLALQRVKSLTLRNRMALDKLSSYPRASTPSRSPSLSHTSSSASGSSTTKSTTSSRLSHPPRRPPSSHSHSQSQPSTSTHQSADPLSRSGSETERESFYSGSNTSHTHLSNHSNQHLRSLSHHQPRSGGARTPPTPHRSTSTRVSSRPDSPLTGRVDRNSNNDVTTSSNGSSPSRRRKRVSVLLQDELEGSGRAKSSLSFVERDRPASYSTKRRSAPFEQLSAGKNRARGALPAEFRGEGGEMISAEPEPITPYRAPSIAFTSSNSSSASASASASGSGTSSTRPRHSFTVRGQTKWASEDLTRRSSSPFAAPSASTSSSQQRAGNEHNRSSTTMMGMGEYRERKQSLRGGSAESALGHTHPRTLVGEGLRAAGLSPTKNRMQRMSLGSAIERDGDAFRRVHDDGWASYDDEEDAGSARRTRAGTLISSRSGAVRAATSMADYRFLGRERDEGRGRDNGDVAQQHQAPRASKSGYPLRREEGRERSLTRMRELSLTREREREPDRRDVEREVEHDRDRNRSSSSMAKYGTLTHAHLMQQDAHPSERYASPFGSRRHLTLASSSSASPATQQQQQRQKEHTRLMVDSLAMFEGHLARLGIGGSAELVQSAQGIVGSAERLNSMLRASTQRAVEQQVAAEVDNPEGRGKEFSEFWLMVGGEYRDSLRVSDELVRGLTGFLLGVGKAVRDVAANGGADFGQHGRSVSLDEEGLGLVGGRKRRSMSPDVVLGDRRDGRPGSTGGGSGSGRRSVESRRSWEPAREGVRNDASRRLSARADSALGSARPSSAFNTLREHDRERPLDGRYETPPPTSAQSRGTGTTRRLFAPSDLRDSVATPPLSGGMPTIHSQETFYTEYEPSPTPAPRNQNQTTLDRSQTLPPLAIPKPLPALPSESLRRNRTFSTKPGTPSTNPNQEKEHDRRKGSLASISTVRTNNSYFPAMLTTPSNATTALTPHTVSTSHTPDRTAFPSLHRTDSDRSTRSTVTFSRPSTVSVSALNGLQQQHLENQRKRTESGASSGAEPSTSVPPNRTSQVLSGSETERDIRRKTLGARAGRASLDDPGENAGGGSKTSTVHPADRSAAVSAGGGSMLPPMNTARRERRRTVTDIWPKE